MARRQNHKLSAKSAKTDMFTLPEQITKPIHGLDQDAQDFVNTLLFGYRFGNRIFDTQTPHHEDWIMLFVILTNEAEGRATVTKNIVEITGRAWHGARLAAAVRAARLYRAEPAHRPV